MEIPASVIYYFIIYRVLMIAAGVISIILGYKLFCKGIWPTIKSGKEPSIGVKIMKTELTLKNAAPGTFFALFGVIIISIMVIYGSPEYTFEQLDEAKAKIEQKNLKSRIVLKNLESDDSKQHIYDILRKYKKEKIQTVQEAYTEIKKIFIKTKNEND